jgi:hypothetical protein
MKYAFLFFTCFAYSLSAHAQGGKEAFKVLATKGNNTVVQSGESSATPLVIGAKVFDQQIIHIADGGYLSMIHATGKSIELKKAGAYPVKDLVAQAGQATAGLASKYANFVIGELTRNDLDINKEHRKNMTVTGSVERSTGAHALAVSVPRSLVILRNQLTVNLASNEANGSFTYTLMNMFEETLATGSFKGNSLTVTLPDSREVTDQGVLLVIKDAVNSSRSSKAINISMTNEQARKNIEQEIKQLSAELSEENAVNKLVMSSYFEEKRLFVEAEQHLKDAVSMAPDVEAYSMALRQFYKRNGIE